MRRGVASRAPGLLAVVSLALASLALTTVVSAQDTGAAPRRVIRLDDIVVTPARPTALYFVGRSRPESRVEDLRESFTTEIVASTGGAPF